MIRKMFKNILDATRTLLYALCYQYLWLCIIKLIVLFIYFSLSKSALGFFLKTLIWLDNDILAAWKTWPHSFFIISRSKYTLSEFNVQKKTVHQIILNRAKFGLPEDFLNFRGVILLVMRCFNQFWFKNYSKIETQYSLGIRPWYFLNITRYYK